MAIEQEREQLDFCLLIPCYNNYQGLITAIDHVRYTEGKYLIVVVDDGSDVPVFLDMENNLTNLHLIRLPVNRGIVPALNAGLEWICSHTNCRYIARLDCSDLCHETRFQKQVHFLDAHPQVGLLGSWCLINEQGGKDIFVYKAPIADPSIRRAMHWRNLFLHPSVMFRTKLVQAVGFYSDQYPHAEDYALFWAMLQQAEGAVLPEVLVTCTVHAQSISGANRKVQLMSCERIIARFGTSKLLRMVGALYTRFRLMVPQHLMRQLKVWRGLLQGAPGAR